jgi:hypothetical protein
VTASNSESYKSTLAVSCSLNVTKMRSGIYLFTYHNNTLCYPPALTTLVQLDDQPRQCVFSVGLLHVELAQQLTAEVENMGMEANSSQRHQRAPPTFTKWYS